MPHPEIFCKLAADYTFTQFLKLIDNSKYTTLEKNKLPTLEVFQENSNQEKFK